MSTPSDRKYLQTHEWHKQVGDLVEIGITLFAADELTDVTYVALPKVGTTLKAGGRFGEIESVKATSDMYCGISGTVVEVNSALTADPGIVNRQPYTTGWMIRVKPTPELPTELAGLLDLPAYLKATGH
jgi:glycine cleavage system H protein